MKNKISILILLFIYNYSFSQKKDENIGTEVVNVVKSYAPTVSDAFKIKETPTLDDAETSKKEEIKYQIFSFPVASTFTPSKGKAAGVEKIKPEQLFSNFATLGFGNLNSINAELFLTYQLDKFQYLGAMVRHNSSQGGIKGIDLSNKFSDTSADLMYGFQRKDINWKTDFGYKNELYNWYGLPLKNSNFLPIHSTIVRPNHQYHTVNVTSDLKIDKSFFNEIKLNYIGFQDSYESKENRFIIQPSFTFDFGSKAIKTNFKIDYLNTSFNTNYAFANPITGVDSSIKKSNLIFSANPSFQILNDDLSLEIGAEFVYFSRLKNVFGGFSESPKSNFFVYPKLNASLRVVGDNMIAFAGAEGKLIQNSYADFENQNKFISPTLLIEPTDQQYELFVGLKGKLASILGYNIKASYNTTKNKALFVSNPYLQSPIYNYSFGNSFDVVYDNLKTVSFFGEIKADVNKNVTFGFNAELNKYTPTQQDYAWNLPEVKATIFSEFNVGKKWYAGTDFFFVGSRKDQFTNSGFVGAANSVQNLDSFFDLNAHIGYKHNERLTGFIKGNNLANQNYNKWLNYPVQGVQVILGASYKFDF
jgi:outer membrane receptor protein involved in Fe transport